MLQLGNNILWLMVIVLSLFGSAVSQASGQIRLIGGTSPREGRVEIYYNGEWGTVCDDSWSIEDANVVCRQLGFGQAVDALQNAVYGEGTGQIWLDDVICTGSEYHLQDCSRNSWGDHNCGHHEDAGVICDSGYGNVRLVNGLSGSSGRVEIFYNNEWGTICDDSFDDNDAEVICRQLGYASAVTYYSHGYYGSGNGPILGNIDCYGYESNWDDCSFSSWNTLACSHTEDVGVQCASDYPVTPGYGDVRLADSYSSSEGRVEIFYNNEWGTICDDYFDNDDAEVICRQLGYSGDAVYYSNALYGPGNGPILGNIDCYGSESRWNYCSFSDWDTSSCSHSEDVGVQCLGSHEGTVRLVDGYSPSEGRVEIYNEGEWGTICDDSFDTDDANVLCQQLGYSRASDYYTNSYFGSGNGPILETLECSGYEVDWTYCYYDNWDTSICTHSEDVGISCSDIHQTGSVVGIVVGLIIFVLVGICCCSICVFAIKSSTRSGRSRNAAGVNQLVATQPPVTQPPPVVTNQTTGGDCPPSYKDVISNPVTYPVQNVQTNPAYPPQNYPQQPYPTQQGVAYPVQPAVTPYPVQTAAGPYPPQTGVAPYPSQPAPAPYPQQSNVVPYPPQPVNPNQAPAAAPVYPPPPTQPEMYPQQGNPQSGPSAPPVQPGDTAPYYESAITPSE